MKKIISLAFIIIGCSLQASSVLRTNPDKQLYDAVVQKNQGIVVACVQDGLRFTYADAQGNTALDIARELKDQQYFEYLILFANDDDRINMKRPLLIIEEESKEIEDSPLVDYCD